MLRPAIIRYSSGGPTRHCGGVVNKSNMKIGDVASPEVKGHRRANRLSKLIFANLILGWVIPLTIRGDPNGQVYSRVSPAFKTFEVCTSKEIGDPGFPRNMNP